MGRRLLFGHRRMFFLQSFFRDNGMTVLRYCELFANGFLGKMGLMGDLGLMGAEIRKFISEQKKFSRHFLNLARR